MPKTLEEIVGIKFFNLKKKWQNADQLLQQLQAALQSTQNLSLMNVTLDNLHLSMDEFLSNFEDASPTSQATGERRNENSVEESDQASEGDTNSTDLSARVDDLERVIRVVIKALYGDGEASIQTGIVPQMTVLENSLKEGIHKLASMEEKMNSLSVELDCNKFTQEMGVIVATEHRERDCTDLEVREYCHRLMERTEHENLEVKEHCHRLTERTDRLVSENTELRQRLEHVESQARTGYAVADPTAGKEDIQSLKREIEGLKVKTASFIHLITHIQRKLESQDVYAFKVVIKHDGPWNSGSVIKKVDACEFNFGDAFQIEQCRFLVPKSGIYLLILYLSHDRREEPENVSRVQLWVREVPEGRWKEPLCIVSARNVEGCDVMIVHLQRGEAVHARVHSSMRFHQCLVQGMLIKAFN